MAVLEMCKINICAMKENRKQILELLQREGCLEITEMVDENNLDEKDELFHKMNTSTQISIYERNANLAESALEIMQEYSPEKTSIFSSLEGNMIISQDEYLRTVDNQQEILSLVNDVIKQKKQIAELESKSARCRDEIKALEPWRNLDVPMNFEGTKRTGFMLGSIPGAYDQETINENIYIQVIHSDKYQTYVAVSYIRENQKETEEILRHLGFSKPVVVTHHTPLESIKKRNNWIMENQLDIENIKALISEESSRRQDIKNVADYYRARAQKYKVLGQLNQTAHTFFVSGYIAEEDLTRIRYLLEEKFDVIIDVEDLTNGNIGCDNQVPVKLGNSQFSGAVEGVVTAFGYPNKREIDPTSITAIFYYILFGIMFSDAAYGFIIATACFLLLKKYPNMKETMAKTFRMFMYCGVSTMIWGILFGGYFGNAIPVISETFFGKRVNIPPLWFEPLNEPMKMLIYCLGFGIIHLFTGLAIKGYLAIKEKEYQTFIYDVIFWYVFLIGLLLLLIPSNIFASLAGTKIVFPAWFSNLSKIMALGGMIGILLMGGRQSKNPIKRILLGVYSLYDTTSWLSDLLSYSRLLALGLATGVIAQVINTMAAMGGKSVLGVILFIVVFVGGHTFNMAINLLGAYVHTNRLAFVEFFGKFYEGGGREFKPFKADTKYVKVKEN